MVQTTGKSQAGGDNGGLFISENNSKLPAVRNEARAPRDRGIAIHIINSFHIILSVFKKITSYKKSMR